MTTYRDRHLAGEYDAKKQEKKTATKTPTKKAAAKK